jgi:cellulose synthase/poly-beta-1,6-N-acetylglucosamine synthase-like glycosyltransferase
MLEALQIVVACSLVLLTAPLFFDLAICIVGNLFRVRKAHPLEKLPIRLAVIVPAHDEEVMIARTVASIRAAMGSATVSCATAGGQALHSIAQSSLPESSGRTATALYVVAHNCTDATAAIAARAGAKVLELNDPAQGGKGSALRFGFAAALAAGANAFLVVDADSSVSCNLIAATRAALVEGSEATQCRYELELPASTRPHPITRLRALAFRGMNVVRPRGRSGLRFSAGLFGNGFALTAETLARVPFQANSIVEDMEYHISLVRHGLQVDWIGDAFVHAPLAARGAAQTTQETRWEGGRMGVARHTTLPLLRNALRGDWRAVETLADAWGLPLARAILALCVLALLPGDWSHLYALGCGVIALVYVLQAAWLGPEPRRDLLALLAAPLYLARKAVLTPLVLINSRRRAQWTRTRREAPLP